jgi:3-deoxy-D-manno-octulosonic-acid transferase
VPALFRQLGVSPDAPILIGGSTHNGEEVILTEIAERLREKFPKLFLILVPRHFERSNEVGRQLRERNVKFVYRNLVGENSKWSDGEVNCLLVNTTGELRFFYEHATVVFVGKSLTAIGGQNPIEPGALGKAMVFGPNMQNFSDIAKSFASANGAVQVRDPETLQNAIAGILGDENRRKQLGENAQKIVQENLGAIDRTVEMILEKLKTRGVYIVPKK